jgi:hypothetical protein
VAIGPHRLLGLVRVRVSVRVRVRVNQRVSVRVSLRVGVRVRVRVSVRVGARLSVSVSVRVRVRVRRARRGWVRVRVGREDVGRGGAALTIFSNHTPAKAPTTALAITAASPSTMRVSRAVGGASGLSCTRITPSTSSRIAHHWTDEMRL